MPKKDKRELSPEEVLLAVLQHPLRRELLKLYVEATEMRSPKELALPTNGHLSNVGYHVRVLAEKGAVELVAEEGRRGSVEHFYEPTTLVDEVPWGRAALGLPSHDHTHEPSSNKEDQK
jgi:DNA-binding transcriptional ArsR family regulator